MLPDDRLKSIVLIPRCPRYVRLCSKIGDKADIEALRVRATSGQIASQQIAS